MEDHIDHVVAMLGNISTFAAPTTTISSQLHTLKTEVQQLQTTNADGNPKMYKMPTFNLERFDDYTQQDPVLWWEAFTTQLRILLVAKNAYIGALFLNSKGGCQTWLSHLATSHGVDVPDLKDVITWEELTRLWKKRFIVDDAPTLAINRLFTMSQGNTATRDWLTEWQKIVAEPNLNLPFEQHGTGSRSGRRLWLRHEFYNSTSSMGQVWLDRGGVQGPRPLWQLLLVQQHQAQDLPVPGSGQGGCATPPQLRKLSSAEGEATPPSTLPDSAALLAVSCTSGEDANVASPRYTYEDYAVHLVPPLDQPLHVQQSTACTVSSPSATDSAASPQSIVGDSTLQSRLEELDPLTFTDFQWMPVPSTGRLPKPHCNVLMAQLRDYLHTAVPAPLMDVGVEVVDLLAYIAKIDREFKTQRYDDIDALLLYVRIQIGEATCSALIDCGASRNYISQDFMVRAGLGPRVRRKSQPTQVTLGDGHTHKSIDRCIDAVLVYFAPYASPHRVVPDRPIRHEIILEDGAVPPRGCIYRMSEEELSVLRAQLDDLLEKRWIRPSSSPYGAPVLFVRKKNKDLRLCIDYRKFNAQTIRNADPLPRIDDLLERLGGAQFFSKLDLKSGYHQLEIRKEDRYKTAFKTRGYDKCEFAQQELEYLGHYVTPQGIRPLADKIEALRVWPEPTNTTDVRSFMGLAGYYQRFITGYSRIAAPMTRLQSPKVPFVFDDDARRSFQALKTAMLMAPVLSIYDPTLPTRVITNASGYGIGVVLEQHDGDDWHPVEYFNHKVPPINSLDDARTKELLAFVMALKRWRHFLLGRRRFTWVTDNNPLTYYKTQDTVSSTIGRWMYFIDQFDFTPKHVPDLSNRAADALSRRPDLCAMSHHSHSTRSFNDTSSGHISLIRTSARSMHNYLRITRRPAIFALSTGTSSSTREARTYYVSQAIVVFGLASSASIMNHDSPAISESTALLHDFESDSDDPTSLPMSLGISTLAKFADAASPATAIPTASYTRCLSHGNPVSPLPWTSPRSDNSRCTSFVLLDMDRRHARAVRGVGGRVRGDEGQGEGARNQRRRGRVFCLTTADVRERWTEPVALIDGMVDDPDWLYQGERDSIMVLSVGDDGRLKDWNGRRAYTRMPRIVGCA
ncbi:hypothetical protein CBR_g24292 [Chara braunii]|uniref:Uncharacterized protein n=1 Tax=Chara braunii TaxID=69332 RepID=A0A388JME7_CHABU|nr:hypothetical protein CBR_g24292 [Chara braunii]|eukprot:GBG58941.1 hypothetical protein CBR_g24292 [Chara braunii]